MVRDREFRSLPGWIAAAGAGGHEIVKAAAQFGHGCVDGEQIFRRDRAQCDYDLGLDHGDLPHEKRRTGFAFVALGRAVSGGRHFTTFAM